MKKKYAGWCFVLPGFAGVLVFYLIPFFDVIRRSFVTAVDGEWSGLDNYRTIFSNQAFRLAAGNTAKFTAVCLPLLLLLSFLTALLLRKQKKAAPFLKSAYLAPLAIPAASVVLLWEVLFDYHGILNGILSFFHLSVHDWMNTGASLGVLVFSYIWKNLGYDVVLWLAALSSVPETVYEAAEMDGADNRQTLFYITLPCIRPAMFTIVVISLLNSFKVFREAWMAAGNYPDEHIYLLQHLFNNWFRELSVDKMAAGSVVLSAVVFLLIFMLQKGWDHEEM